MSLDLRCYVITSGTGRTTVEKAAAAAAAGAGVVQVRAKDVGVRDLMALCGQVRDAVRTANPATRVVVDDRADVAYAVGLDGVHLGQDDLPVADARRMLGPDATIGLTTGTLALAEAAREVGDLIDYVGAGPFRPTPTKDSGRPPLGLAGYPPIVAASPVPVVAIGDVQVDDVADLAATGVAGVVMVRAVMGADDPGEVVTRAMAEWERALRS
ncbi:thiamine phosphate synthase [Mariniluteicoccus endophyticus]